MLLIAGILILAEASGGAALSQLNLALPVWAFAVPLASRRGVALLFQSERTLESSGQHRGAGRHALVTTPVVAVGFPVPRR